jgi:streptomycin 6-kinase
VLLIIGTLDALSIVLYTAWMARKHLQSAHWERVLQGDAEHTTIRDYSVRGFHLSFCPQRPSSEPCFLSRANQLFVGPLLESLFC